MTGGLVLSLVSLWLLLAMRKQRPGDHPLSYRRRR